MTWQIQLSDIFESKCKKFDKKHPDEFAAMQRNLEKYFEALKEGLKPMQINAGYIHNEKKGVLAFDQSGCTNPKPMQSRMYVYPETDKGLLHLITVGEKGARREQQRDIKLAHSYVDQLKKEQ